MIRQRAARIAHSSTTAQSPVARRLRRDLICPVSRLQLSVCILASLVLTAQLTITPAAFSAGKNANAHRQAIYSLSTRQETSEILGVSGVPSYVVFPEGTRRGLYITGVKEQGQWRNFGLRPGDVLLTIDRHVIQSAPEADRILLPMQNGMKDITYARSTNPSAPQLISNRVEYEQISYLLSKVGSHSASATSYAGSASSQGSGSRAGDGNWKEPSISELESHMAQLVNQDRSHNGGLPSLEVSSALTKLARDEAEAMLRQGFFAHVDPQGRSPQERARLAGIRSGVYENIAFQGQGLSPDMQLVEAAEAQMMAEPPNQENHRFNILHPEHHYMGIGVARAKNTVMMVQEFTDGPP